jgi:hypothetical protein
MQDLWPDMQTGRKIDELLRTRWLLDFEPDAVAIKNNFLKSTISFGNLKSQPKGD